MSELIECALEGCEPGALVGLLEEMLARATGSIACELQRQSSTDVTVAATPHTLAGPLMSGEACFLNVRIDAMQFAGGSELPRVLLQIFPAGGAFDLLLNFEEGDVVQFGEALEHLQAFCLRMKDQFALKSVYCGMDPASDQETRFFTDEKRGPLSA